MATSYYRETRYKTLSHRRFSGLGFSTTGKGVMGTTTSDDASIYVCNLLDDFFPEPPFSYCAPSMFRRKPGLK